MSSNKQLSLVNWVHNRYTGHLKIAKLCKLLRKKFFWHGIIEDMKKVIDRCTVCYKLRNVVEYKPLKPIECIYLFEIVSLDKEHVSLAIGAKEYFIITVGHFTR